MFFPGLSRPPTQTHAAAPKIITPVEPNYMMSLNEAPHQENHTKKSSLLNPVVKSLHNNSVDFIEMLTLDAKEFLTIKCVCAVKSDTQEFCKECFGNYKGSLDNVNGEKSENKSMDTDDSVLISETNGSCEAKNLNNRLLNAGEIVVETDNDGEQRPDYKTNDRLSYAKCTNEVEPIDSSQSCICTMNQSTDIHNDEEIKPVNNGNTGHKDEDLERAVLKFLQESSKAPNSCALGKKLENCGCHSLEDSNRNLLSSILKVIQNNYHRVEEKCHAGAESDEEKCERTQMQDTDNTGKDNFSECSDFPKETSQSGREGCNENVFLKPSKLAKSCECKKSKLTESAHFCSASCTRRDLINFEKVRPKQICVGKESDEERSESTQTEKIEMRNLNKCGDPTNETSGNLEKAKPKRDLLEDETMENAKDNYLTICNDRGNVGNDAEDTMASSSAVSGKRCQPSSEDVVYSAVSSESPAIHSSSSGEEMANVALCNHGFNAKENCQANTDSCEPLSEKAGKEAGLARIALDPKKMLENVVNPASPLANSSERPSRSNHREQAAYRESCASLVSIANDGRLQEQAPISSREFAVDVVPIDAAGVRVNPAAVNLLLTEAPSDFCQTCTGSEGPSSEPAKLIGPQIAAAKQQELTWEFRNGRLVFAEDGSNSANNLQISAEEVVCSGKGAIDQQESNSEQFSSVSSVEIEVEPPVPQISNCSTDGSILSPNHILSSRDINKRAGDLNSRLKYLEDKLKKAGITDAKEETLTGIKDNTETDKNNNRNNLRCPVEEESSCNCSHNKDSLKPHQYVAFNENLEEENCDPKVINYSDFQKDSTDLKEIVRSGTADKGIDSGSEDFIPEGFQDFCQFDVNNLTGFPAFDANESLGIYDEFLEDSSSDESCDCVEDDHFIVIR